MDDSSHPSLFIFTLCLTDTSGNVLKFWSRQHSTARIAGRGSSMAKNTTPSNPLPTPSISTTSASYLVSWSVFSPLVSKIRNPLASVVSRKSQQKILIVANKMQPQNQSFIWNVGRLCCLEMVSAVCCLEMVTYLQAHTKVFLSCGEQGNFMLSHSCSLPFQPPRMFSFTLEGPGTR